MAPDHWRDYVEGDLRGKEYHVTIPRHKPLKLGTLSGIVKDVASYLEMEWHVLIRELFV